MNQFLNAGPGSDEERNKIREILAQKGLVGFANDTKWSELIRVMKNKEGWQPNIEQNGYLPILSAGGMRYALIFPTLYGS